jgi:peptide/nickel transport system substrate-binding protein
MNMTKVSRRTFLYGSAAAAGATLIGACSGGDDSPGPAGASGSASAGATASVGSQTKPLPNPAAFQQSPALQGKGLPPVEQRLPESPYVVPHRWVSRGKYGGVLRTCVFGTTGLATAGTNKEFFYGFSPTRWLNDGVDIGAGTADRWSSNPDATEWTIHFRTGLRWSDGHLFDVEDVLFWYYDIAVPENAGQSVPPDCLSAKGTQCRMSRVDRSTLKISYDSPQPLVPDYLAEWVKGGMGNGPQWLLPKHYLKQFHPKYNRSVSKAWDQPGGLWEQHADWMRNPECPTLVGYKCKSFDNSRSVVLERNPYYYAVSKEGDQLPYIDEWIFTIYQSADTLKLSLQQGKFDYCQGQFNQIDLSDVSTLSSTKE